MADESRRVSSTFTLFVSELMFCSIMATLDATQQRLLEMSPDNPNSPTKAETINVRPGLGFSKSTTGVAPKLSLRETMLAQKKAAMANKNLPPRPGSAMSTFSPVRTVSSSSTASAVSAVSTTSETGPVRMRQESTVVAHGGLSVAPMRPTKFKRPELAARPATAGPYSVRRPGHGPSTESTVSPTTAKAPKARTPSASNISPPKKIATRPNTSYSSHASQSSHASPTKATITRVLPSPRPSPGKPKAPTSGLVVSSPSKADEELTMVVPSITGLKESYTKKALQPVGSSDDEDLATPMKGLQVYEDPFSSTDDQTTPRPAFTAPVLGEVAVNEDAFNLARNGTNASTPLKAAPTSPESFKQNSRLLESGISKIKAKSLDVHGFRKLQGLIRDHKAGWSENKFDALLLGLFEYLESPLTSLTPEKVQDVKAQILATIKLMYKKDREAFRPHVLKGLQSILATRSSYDARTHIVSGLELLADELVTIADPREVADTITTQLQHEEMALEGCRTLSMGLHVLKELLEVKEDFVPDDDEVNEMCKLAARCLESSDSGVRMDAVQLAVCVHAKVGESRFWSALGGVRDDPKSLITYYIVKRQREIAAGRCGVQEA